MFYYRIFANSHFSANIEIWSLEPRAKKAEFKKLDPIIKQIKIIIRDNEVMRRFLAYVSHDKYPLFLDHKKFYSNTPVSRVGPEDFKALLDDLDAIADYKEQKARIEVHYLLV